MSFLPTTVGVVSASEPVPTPGDPTTDAPGPGAGRNDRPQPLGTIITPALVALAVIADALLVILFAALGRRSHEEADGLTGMLSTAWPFLIGLALGWLVVLGISRAASRTPHPLRAWPVGVAVWVCTVLAGMLLRAAVGDGTAFAFILVATGFNLLTLVGWRLLAQLAAARHRMHL